MDQIAKWADRIYAESDFGRSVATSVSGVIGLIVYLALSDWVISAFSTIITFPIIRILSSGLHEKFNRSKKRALEHEEMLYEFNRLSITEHEILKAFVRAGGSVMTWTQMNNEVVPSAGVESLIHRELLHTSTTADGMRETFVINERIFDIANEKFGTKKSS
ncbi:hypothetical protein ACVSNS_01465 [Pseudomonas aeruginosa]